MSKVLSIVTHPHPVLSQVCNEVIVFDRALRELAGNMLHTIGPNENNRERTGVGLAAPQVNEPIRMVVIAAPGFPETVLVNPVIERAKGSQSGVEGCLSLPGTRGEVCRYTDLWLSYQDLDGKVCRMKARDCHARVIQHEVDHLFGVEFTQRVGKSLPNHQNVYQFPRAA